LELIHIRINDDQKIAADTLVQEGWKHDNGDDQCHSLINLFLENRTNVTSSQLLETEDIKLMRTYSKPSKSFQ
jgi:hypothetical protein